MHTKGARSVHLGVPFQWQGMEFSSIFLPVYSHYRGRRHNKFIFNMSLLQYPHAFWFHLNAQETSRSVSSIKACFSSSYNSVLFFTRSSRQSITLKPYKHDLLSVLGPRHHCFCLLFKKICYVPIEVSRWALWSLRIFSGILFNSASISAPFKRMSCGRITSETVIAQ